MPRQRVVVAESSVTAGQMKDFWEKVQNGTIGSQNFGGFLENPHRFTGGQTTITRAINILGSAKVVTSQQAIDVWCNRQPRNTMLSYSDTELRVCAQANERNEADWRLVYFTGPSLREQRERKGTDTKKQPCFYSNEWWLERAEDDWATRKPMAGYYLHNFKPQFGGMKWQQQEEAIAKLGCEFERADEVVIAEACFSIFGVTGERLLENWYHWGRSETSFGDRVFGGDFDSGGFDVSGSHPGDYGGHLRVVVSRKSKNLGL